MGTRGQHTTGYYLALLYALDARYQEQSWHALEPGRWTPAPRRRPEQFLRWTRTCLAALGNVPSQTFTQHISALKRHGLRHIAIMLKEQFAERDVDFGRPPSQGEQHPQARKIAAHLRDGLDARWLNLLSSFSVPKTAEEALALALGGLPPNFSVITELFETLLPDHDPMALSVWQGFSLATGCPPRPPDAWHSPLKALRGLSQGDLIELNSLSSEQLKQLRTIDPQAQTILNVRERVSCSHEQWRFFAESLLALDKESVEQVALALSQASQRRVRLRRLPKRSLQSAAYLLAYWPAGPALLRTFKAALTDLSWQGAMSISPELARAIVSASLSPVLLERIQAWTKHDLEQVRTLLQTEPVLSQLEDSRLIHELQHQRSPAWLRLADIFPSSTDYLSKLLSRYYNDALLLGWDEIETQAHAVANQLQQSWLERSQHST